MINHMYEQHQHFSDLNIDIPRTPQQHAVYKCFKVYNSCKNDEHLLVFDNMMDNLYNMYGYNTWHKAKELITRT